MSVIARIIKRILCVNQLLIHILRISCSIDADVCIPGTHCPSGCVVCIKWDGIRVIFDLLKVCDEVLRSLRKIRDSRFFKNLLVINYALSSCCGRNSIYFFVVFPGMCVVDFLFHIIYGIKWHKISRKI